MSHNYRISNICKQALTTCKSKTQICSKVVKPVQVMPVRTEYSWPGYGSRYGFSSWRMKKDFMKRKVVKEQFPERMRLNAIRKNSILPQTVREIADKEIAELPRNSNPIRLVDRCVLTGRGRGTKTRYRVSRIMYRQFADYGQMSGVTRACW